jgi:hypothetical protein
MYPRASTSEMRRQLMQIAPASGVPYSFQNNPRFMKLGHFACPKAAELEKSRNMGQLAVPISLQEPEQVFCARPG